MSIGLRSCPTTPLQQYGVKRDWLSDGAALTPTCRSMRDRLMARPAPATFKNPPLAGFVAAHTRDPSFPPSRDDSRGAWPDSAATTVTHICIIKLCLRAVAAAAARGDGAKDEWGILGVDSTRTLVVLYKLRELWCINYSFVLLLKSFRCC